VPTGIVQSRELVTAAARAAERGDEDAENEERSDWEEHAGGSFLVWSRRHSSCQSDRRGHSTARRVTKERDEARGFG
jgi:hypothetical protein